MFVMLWWQPCNPSIGAVEVGAPWSTLASQTSPVSEFCVPGRDLSKYKMGWC